MFLQLFINGWRSRSILVLILTFATLIGCAPADAPSEARETTPAESEEGAIDTATAVVSGIVVGGGDTTAQGLTDAPRTFVYDVKMEDGALIKVTYTAFPPSPVVDREGSKIRLEFHQGSITNGDYLIAHGSYDANTGIVTVAEEGDYIETYPEKP